MAVGENSEIFAPEEKKNFFQKIGWKKLTILILIILLLLGGGGYAYYVSNQAEPEVVEKDKYEFLRKKVKTD